MNFPGTVFRADPDFENPEIVIQLFLEIAICPGHGNVGAANTVS